MACQRFRVLSSFKNLHKARMQVFEGDKENLAAVRLKINEEFRKQKNITDKAEIEKFIQVADEVAQYLKTMIIQGQFNENTGAYELKITKDTKLEDNIPYPHDNSAPKSTNKRTDLDNTK